MAAGLVSLIIGEQQVLVQVAAAYSAAREQGTVGKILSRLFQAAIRVGKRARTETAISQNSASIASVAVQLIAETVPDLAAARILVLGAGVPVAECRWDPGAVTIGLAFDLEAGNLVKATRFGYVIRAAHGSRLLSYDELRGAYSGTIVDLAEGRFRFMNTLFSLSEASLFAQLVDLHDQGRLPGVKGYPELYRRLLRALDETHTQGDLKQRIVADPDRFVDLDPDLPQTLADLRAAGKVLLLITNSDWFYTRAMMNHAFDGMLGPGRSCRELFDVVIV